MIQILIITESGLSSVMSAKGTTVTHIPLDHIPLMHVYGEPTHDVKLRGVMPTLILIPDWIDQDNIDYCFEWAVKFYERSGVKEENQLINYYPKR